MSNNLEKLLHKKANTANRQLQISLPWTGPERVSIPPFCNQNMIVSYGIGGMCAPDCHPYENQTRK